MKARMVSKGISLNTGIPVGAEIEVWPNTEADAGEMWLELGPEEGGPCPWFTNLEGDETWYLRADEVEIVDCPDHWHCDPDTAAHRCDQPDRTKPCPTCRKRSRSSGRRCDLQVP